MSDIKTIALQFAMQLNKGNVDDTINAARQIETYLGETGEPAAAAVADKPKPVSRRASSREPAAAETAAEPAKEETKPVETISRDDMLMAATLFTQKHGDQALIDTLDQMGAAKFSEVPAERYAEFKALLDDYQPKSASALD